ncbi:hypothetical protein [Palleronia sp. THAF1]|uniref:hypothetical protein n=1 Tax=Palleronia sp. THAF1 TaxID=2587842 RepID=UPI0012693CF2|nr:hypothetical protein [Palleronia sp. THAF1]
MMFRTILFPVVVALLPVAASAQVNPPTHAPIIEEPPLPGVVQGCGFYSVLGSARSLSDAFTLQDTLGAIGSGAHDNRSIPQFRDGYYSVTYGPFANEALAADKVSEWRDRVPDAHVKYGCVDGVPGQASALPISRGHYVREGTLCDNAPNAAIRVYDGAGISGSATRDCTLDVTEVDGPLYGGTNTCTDTYDGQRSASALSVRVLSANRFRLAENGRIEGDYRLCREG